MAAGQKVNYDAEMRRMNAELRTDIAKLCNRPNRTRREVMLLLGKTCAGKSCLINTLIKAMCGQYIPRAKMGAGVAQSKTIVLERFQNCGVEEIDFEDDESKEAIVPIIEKLPTIYDFAGQPDEGETMDALEEILEVIIGGYIPNGTAIEYLQNMQESQGIGNLKDIFKEHRDTTRQVTKVIFVQNCTDLEPPRNIIRCMEKVLRKMDDTTGQLLYPAEVFVVLTKYDLVRDQDTFEKKVSAEETISLEDFKKAEDNMASEFSIQGALRHNRIRWVSYVDSHTEDNPNIDKIALEFLKKLLQTGGNVPPDTPPAPIMTWRKSAKLFVTRQFKEICNTTYQLPINPVFTLCIVMVIAIVIFYVFKNSVI